MNEMIDITEEFCDRLFGNFPVTPELLQDLLFLTDWRTCVKAGQKPLRLWVNYGQSAATPDFVDTLLKSQKFSSHRFPDSDVNCVMQTKRWSIKKHRAKVNSDYRASIEQVIRLFTTMDITRFYNLVASSYPLLVTSYGEELEFEALAARYEKDKALFK